MTNDNVFYPLILHCQCYEPKTMMECVCPTNEKALRAYSGQNSAIPAMTTEQRAWCLGEIGSVEGYDRSDYTLAPDSELARAVLDAWTDYCRDKGML